jgi:Carbohydrate/starch-binding module (family 21)
VNSQDVSTLFRTHQRYPQPQLSKIVEDGGRKLEAENLKELQAAISAIEPRTQCSPDRTQDETNKAHVNYHDFAAGTRPPLSREARKISSVQVSSPAKFKQDSDEDEDSDGTPTSRPSMVRKKSGELVRPALRPPSHRRPSSMSGIPTFSKAVSFDSHLEHVRHFLQVDRPLGVSADSSPVEQYESETEFAFGSDEYSSRSRAPPFEWEIKLSNFPYQDVKSRKSLPVHVERIFLSSDNKTLIGSIAVQDLAFHKTVVCRFTFDYWKTISEVVADYNHDARQKQQNDGLDRFNFSVKLADQVNLENKTMVFCVRYIVNGQEYWDNNNGFNYQVDFSKESKPQHGKNGMPGLGARPLNTLPRSRSSAPTSSGQRPKSYPVSFDDFANGFDGVSFGQSAGSLMGEPKLKRRTPSSKAEIVSDAPTRRSHPNSQAFGNRYDFNSSLTAPNTHFLY